jgi:RES domain-containing protein
MPIVWRLTPPNFAHDLSGEGASIIGGRWNSRGRLMLYTSSHLSLAVLEVFVHIAPELRDRLPELEAVQIYVPDDAGSTTIADSQFSDLIAGANPLDACRAIGDAWLARGEDLVLRAPSVVIPQEHNIMLNPAHPRMAEVAIVSTQRFKFDPRLAAR